MWTEMSYYNFKENLTLLQQSFEENNEIRNINSTGDVYELRQDLLSIQRGDGCIL